MKPSTNLANLATAPQATPSAQSENCEVQIPTGSRYFRASGIATAHVAPMVAIVALEYCLRQSLGDFFRTQVSPISAFLARWDCYQDAQLPYEHGETWQSLNDKMHRLLADFLVEELPCRIYGVQAIELPYLLATPGGKKSSGGVIDLLAAVEGLMSAVRFAVVNFPSVTLSPILRGELYAYLAVEPRAQQSVACLFVLGERERIAWHRLIRSKLPAGSTGDR